MLLTASAKKVGLGIGVRNGGAETLSWSKFTPTNERPAMAQQPLIVFDVNETLLDLETIRPTFERIFDDPAAMRLWFANLITYSEALTLAGRYVPFTDIGAAVLRMLAPTRGITVSDADGAELTERFASMPPHPEVPAALRRLRDHGFRLFTLTDNTLGSVAFAWRAMDAFYEEDERIVGHAADAYHRIVSYRKPYREVDRIAGMVSFEPDKVTVVIDGLVQHLAPGQQVISHGADRNLTLDEVMVQGRS